MKKSWPSTSDAWLRRPVGRQRDELVPHLAVFVPLAHADHRLAVGRDDAVGIAEGVRLRRRGRDRARLRSRAVDPVDAAVGELAVDTSCRRGTRPRRRRTRGLASSRSHRTGSRRRRPAGLARRSRRDRPRQRAIPPTGRSRPGRRRLPNRGLEVRATRSAPRVEGHVPKGRIATEAFFTVRRAVCPGADQR